MSHRDLITIVEKMHQDQQLAQKYLFQTLQSLRAEFTLKLDRIQELLEKASLREEEEEESKDSEPPGEDVKPDVLEEIQKIQKIQKSPEIEVLSGFKTKLVEQMSQYDDYRQDTSKFQSAWKIMLPDGTCVECEMSNGATVWDIKKKIEEERRIPALWQTFFLRGKRHENHEKLHNLMVTANQTTCRIYYDYNS